MKKAEALYIRISQPCSQNWEAMEQVGEGKHCTQCNNIVFDLSQLTDDELWDFMKKNPAIHCGRFHNSQLNRTILPSIPGTRFLITKFNRVAAAFFTLFSFKALTSQAGIKNENTSVVLNGSLKFKRVPSKKVIISGIIKDSEGNPLEKATVSLDTVQVAITDAMGRFSFELEILPAGSHNLYFNHGDLITAVRSYNIAMASTSYDIVLAKKGEGYHTAGIMIPKITTITGEIPSIVFKTGIAKLSADNKIILVEIARAIKQQPFANVTLTSYPVNRAAEKLSSKRMENIKVYLVENEGISADRITVELQLAGGNANTVDIK